jgi:hypothetical protein
MVAFNATTPVRFHAADERSSNLSKDSRNLTGYVADAATLAKINRFATVCYVAADLARAACGSPDAAASERIWQARWIAARLQLPQTGSAPFV